jgi:hypothetical protein
MGRSEILNRMRDARDQERIARREYEEYILETYGMDSCEDGDILVWSKQFTEGGKKYDYVARRGGGSWYITGNTQHYSWVELLEEIERDNAGTINIYKVSEVEPLIIEEEDAE